MAKEIKNQVDKKEDLLERICLRTLRVCTTDFGIVAGRGHFSQYWTRDACFASWGYIAKEKFEPVQNQLNTIINYCGIDGEVPLRIGRRRIVWDFFKYRFLKKRPHDPEPLPVPDKNQVLYKHKTNADGNSLTVITATLFLLAQKRSSHNVFPYLIKIFNAIPLEKGLISQHHFQDWEDSIRKQGHGIYANALYYGAALSLAALSEDQEKEFWKNKAERIREAVYQNLWNGQYFNNFADKKTSVDNFSVSGNMLALLFGLPGKEDAKKMIDFIENAPEIKERPGLAVFPPYRPDRVALPYRLIGLAEYHAGLQWSWITGLMLLTYQLIPTKNEKANTENVIDSLARLMLNDENNQRVAFVPEVYKNNKPFANFFYESEKSFAWGAGMILAGMQKDSPLLKALQKIRKERKED